MGRKASAMVVTNSAPEYELDINNIFEFTPGGPKLLLDGDPVAYAAASMCQDTIYRMTLNGRWLSEISGGITDVYSAYSVKDHKEWERLLEENPGLSIEKIVTSDSTDQSMYHTIKAQIKKLIKRTGAGSLKIYLTEGSQNFRVTEGIATMLKYKGNRSPNDKPERLEEARNYMIETLGATIAEGKEADDALSIDQAGAWEKAMESAKAYLEGNPDCGFNLEELAMESVDTILATIDKDIASRAGKHINPDDDLGVQEVYPLGKLELIVKDDKSKKLKFNGLRGFYAQCLLGDPTDNIPGPYFCGNVRVYEVLKDCQTEEELFKATLRETYEGIHREHMNFLGGIIEKKVEDAILCGAKDTASNRKTLKSKYKKFMEKITAYGPKFYYHWNEYKLNEDGTVSKELADPSSARVSKLSPLEHLIEVARLVYMLERPIKEDGSHHWQPNLVWAKEVEEEFIEKNLTRLQQPWVL